MTCYKQPSRQAAWTSLDPTCIRDKKMKWTSRGSDQLRIISHVESPMLADKNASSRTTICTPAARAHPMLLGMVNIQVKPVPDARASHRRVRSLQHASSPSAGESANPDHTASEYSHDGADPLSTKQLSIVNALHSRSEAVVAA